MQHKSFAELLSEKFSTVTREQWFVSPNTCFSTHICPSNVFSMKMDFVDAAAFWKTFSVPINNMCLATVIDAKGKCEPRVMPSILFELISKSIRVWMLSPEILLQGSAHTNVA